MRKTPAGVIALGGMMAALAVVIMSLGGMIPVATFVCPVMCMMLLNFVLRMCGRRIAWAWYGAVAILSLLLGPDKEAVAVFLFLGYYPIIKPKLDGMKLGLLLKLLLFNVIIFLMYGILIYLLGMDQITSDYQELGTVMTVVTLLLGNVTFWMLDKALSNLTKKYEKRAG